MFAVVVDFPVYQDGKVVSHLRCVDSRGDWVSCCQRANWIHHRGSPSGVVLWQESLRDVLFVLSGVVLDSAKKDRPLKPVDWWMGIRNRIPAN
jgi:hypothetical protein